MSLSVMDNSKKERDEAVWGLSIASLVCMAIAVLRYWTYVHDVALKASPLIVQFDESFFPCMIFLGLTSFTLLGLALLFKYGE